MGWWVGGYMDTIQGIIQGNFVKSYTIFEKLILLIMKLTSPQKKIFGYKKLSNFYLSHLVQVSELRIISIVEL